MGILLILSSVAGEGLNFKAVEDERGILSASEYLVGTKISSTSRLSQRKADESNY